MAELNVEEAGPSLSLGSLGRPTALITVGGLVGQVFALVRTLFVASRVGTSPDLDALLVAQVLPIVVGMIITSGLRQATVPAYLEIAAGRGRVEASRFAGFVLTWSAIVAICAMALLYLFPAQAISVSGPGLARETSQDAVEFLRIVAPILGLSVLWITLATMCQAERRFVPIAAGLALNPVISFCVTVGLWDRLGLQGVALGLDLGYVATIGLVAVYLIVRGLRPRLTLTFDRDDLGRFIRHALPLLAGASVVQFNLMADRATASILGVGAVSSLNYGQLIVLESIGSLNTAWMLVLYPTLVHLARPSSGGLGKGAEQAVRHAIAFFMPLVVGAIALAPLVVQVAYERGAFDASAARTTAMVVAAFAPMILLTMIQPVLAGAHNARRRGGLIALAAVLNASLNVVLDVVFGLTLGVPGVALSTSVTLVVVMAVLAMQLHRWEPGFAIRPVVSTAARSLLASLVPGTAVALLVWSVMPKLSFLGAIGALFGLAAAGACVYLALGMLLRLDELRTVTDALRRRAGRAAGRAVR
jgi:putative peptidoglycan lipid II flippase